MATVGDIVSQSIAVAFEEVGECENVRQDVP